MFDKKLIDHLPYRAMFRHAPLCGGVGSAGFFLLMGSWLNYLVFKVSRQEPPGFLLSHLTLIQSGCKARLCEQKIRSAGGRFFFSKPSGKSFVANGLFINLLLKMPTGTLCFLLQSGKRNKKPGEEKRKTRKYR
jgi:hypothetical protein